MQKTYPQLLIHLFLCNTVFLFGCRPVINSFTANNYTITADDSVEFRWKVRGNPVLLSFTDTDANTRNFVLVVNKNGKEINRMIAVNVLPSESEDDIIFSVIRNEDSLVATGEKDLLRWGKHFFCKSVSSGSKRDLFVIHDGISAMLPADGTASFAFAGMPNSGNWRIATAMNAIEKKDSTLIPSRLTLNSIIVHHK